MNRTRTIAIFAGIFAIAMTTYGLSGVSASPMIMAAIPQTQENVGMLGHVEYTVFDSDQVVKSYLQTDNIVTFIGKDCVGQQVFGATQAPNGLCADSAAVFDFIAIGNGTGGGENAANEGLENNQCAFTGAASSNGGEMARKQVSPTIEVAASGSGGTQVVLDVGSANTFKFGIDNATTVVQSALFNGNNGVTALTGQCDTYNEGSYEMFAIKDLSGGGVTVAAGDSLAIKWTITLN